MNEEYYTRGSFLCLDGPARKAGLAPSNVKLCLTCRDIELLRSIFSEIIKEPTCYWVKMSSQPKDGMFLGRCFFTTKEMAGFMWDKYKKHPNLMVNLQDDDFANQFRTKSKDLGVEKAIDAKISGQPKNTRNILPRPDFIKHYSEIQDSDNAHYPDSDELLSIGSSFARYFGLKNLGIHHEVLPSGRRTSWPHAESTEEEFVYVIEGTPDVWIDGELYRLATGDAVGFVPGTGICHTFLNNSLKDVRLLVVGESKKQTNKCFYALHPERNVQAKTEDCLWEDPPRRQLGDHDGLPDTNLDNLQPKDESISQSKKS